MINEETPVTAEQSFETQEVAKEQSLTSTPEDAILSREKAAFDAYVRNQGMKIPENFKDAGAWFESLKNAQKEYTKSRQEVADLKKKYEDPNIVGNPNYKAEDAPVAPKAEEIPNLPEILKIPENKPEAAAPQTPVSATEEDWKQWTIEFATNNTLSEQTVKAIQEKTKLPEFVVNEYMQGQKAKLEMAYTKASELVGGRDELNKMFVWASKSLTAAEQESINRNLASPAWDVALYGLQAKYAKSTQTSKPNEPKQVARGQVNLASTQQGITAYQTKREFSAERNNPRFESDPKYRSYVEQRMIRTNFSNLPK
jgi:hypothetical protein